MSKSVYIAGKMRGVPYYNFPAFDAARDRLKALGLEVFSPADMDRANGFDPFNFNEHLIALSNDGGPSCWDKLPLGFDLDAAIERDNEKIKKADATYVLHEGFAESVGATEEVELTMKLGKIVIFDTMTDEQIVKALGMEENEVFAPLRILNARGKPGILGDNMTAETRYTERGAVLDEAKKLITGDRNNSYGPPTQDFQRTADMMTALFSMKLKNGERFKPSDVAWIITLVKASRAQHSPKRDNYVDAAGYMGCGWECEAEEQKRTEERIKYGPPPAGLQDTQSFIRDQFANLEKNNTKGTK